MKPHLVGFAFRGAVREPGWAQELMEGFWQRNSLHTQVSRVDTLAELRRLRDVLNGHGALVGASDHLTTKALCAQDPDGLEFEVCWVVPSRALTDDLTARARANPRPLSLDLDSEIAHFGSDTLGGIGVSIPPRLIEVNPPRAGWHRWFTVPRSFTFR